MNKKVVSLLVIICSILLITSCAFEKEPKEFFTSEEGHDYKKFDKSSSLDGKAFTVEDAGKYEFTVIAKMEKGNFTFKLLNESEEEIFTLEGKEINEKKTIYLEEGVYYLRPRTHNAEDGSYEIHYKKL
ncbi:hypothetical protein [Caldisalinibacter kiritimatiensis]|nr:hypothetical protein [Caldisalinibacter kiritimatiensis]